MSVTEPMAPAPRTAVKTTVIAAVVVLVTFVAGFVVGAVVERLRHGGGRPPRGGHPMVAKAMLERLDQHLGLDDAQEKKIGEILERRRMRIDALWSGVRPRVHAEIEQTNAEIESVLTPEQRAKFEKMRMRLGPPGGRHWRRGDRSRTEPTR